jgi:prepilin-type N-terminal cleavage/methylation domain-containing protein
MKNSAFSLVELSIVLVILGLLTGGVLTGRSLIHAAELRSVTAEVQEFQTTINVFKGKYFALPGDMPNATRFWGDNASECDDPSIADATPGTCNGNGDSIINRAPSADAVGEVFMVWNHLSYADLLNGTFTGMAGSSNRWDADTDINVPASDFSGACYSVTDTILANIWYFDVNYGTNIVQLGTANAPYAGCSAPHLIPEDAWYIDKKIDDGKPATGRVIAKFWNDSCADAGTNDEVDSDYKLSNTAQACALNFTNLF